MGKLRKQGACMPRNSPRAYDRWRARVWRAFDKPSAVVQELKIVGDGRIARFAFVGLEKIPTRRNEPLHCQGSKFLRLDNQRLAFAGDGIVAERGCELYLTNSRVEALGNALIVNGANVHVTNSTIVGGTSSLELRNGAEAYVGGSTLKGLSRRFDTSQLHDLGANQWN